MTSSLIVPTQRGLSAVGTEHPTRVGADSDILYFVLPGHLSRPVATTVGTQGLQEPLLLFAVFQEVLRRYSGQKSVTVSFAQNGGAPRTITLEGNQSMRTLLEQSQEHAGDVGNIELPGHVIHGHFSFQCARDSSDGSHPFANTSGIHFSLESFAEGLTGFIEFRRNLWDRAVVKCFVSSYRNLLASALADLDSPIGQLEILSDADLKTFDTWNATGDFYPRARVDELFDQRVAERPDDTAVTFLGRNISYASLSEETKQLAARLQSLGVQPGTLVGICMDRSVEMVTALLAVFRAGAGYLPLDPSFPQDRLDFMQEDARPLVVITQAHLRERCSVHTAHVLSIDLPIPKSEVTSSAEYLPPQTSSLDDVAYVLYTSGSTGKPKGVQITHRALTNLLVAVSNDLSLDRSEVVLATTTISFDISTVEIFAPLIAGAHLIVAPRNVAVNGELLAKAISESGATLLQATPAGWQVLLEAGWEGQAGLKMLTGGEPLTWILAQRLLQRGAELWNLYGPTEVTVYATGRQIFKDDEKITVGRALANYTAYVLDQYHRRLPVGAIGELFLGGIGVGAGYLNRPELTAEKFLPDPFSSTPEARLYRTGDLARVLPNGEIDILGRADNQVKLRGYRIELEEIEALLDSHPGIAKSVARVTDLGVGDQCLVAYVVPRDRNLVDEADWRRHALRSLPAYMVPTSFLVMESFPLTPNGKVDRKALPAFQLPQLEIEGSSDTTEDSTERTVLCCWRTVLGKPDLGLDHDFFAAGGHSLLVMRMFAQMNDKMGCKLPISLLVEAPTARKFAKLVTQGKDSPAKYLVSMQPEGTLPPVYLVHHLLGDILIYRHVADHFAPHRPVFGVQPPLDLIKRRQPYGLQDLASDYVGEILKRQAGGVVHLAGFSSGSVIAFEMARQLKNLGFEVGLLALIDGDIQAGGPRIPAIVRYAKMATRKLCKVVFKMRDEVADGPKQFVAKRLKHLWLQLRVRLLENSAAQGDVTMEQALLLAERSYEAKPYSGSALLIRFHDEAWEFGPDPMMGWSGLVEGGIEVVDFPGGHITGMGPVSAPTMVAALRGRMENFEAVRLVQ